MNILFYSYVKSRINWIRTLIENFIYTHPFINFNFDIVIKSL